MMTAAKRLGLYSALRACRAIVLRSNRQSRLTVATIFWRVGTIPSTAVICCCSRVRGLGVAAVVGPGVEGPATAFAGGEAAAEGGVWEFDWDGLGCGCEGG